MLFINNERTVQETQENKRLFSLYPLLPKNFICFSFHPIYSENVISFRPTMEEKRGLTLSPYCGSIVLCPISCELRCSEEFLVRVLLVYIHRFKVGFDQSFAQVYSSGDELCLGKVGVKHKRVVLNSQLQCMWLPSDRPTQVPPSIFLATYIPTAAIMLGLHLKNR